MTSTRRQLLIGAAALALAGPAAADVSTDWAIDWQGLPPDPTVLARIERQIAMVRASPVRADILTFWAAQVIHISKVSGEGSRAGEQVLMTRDPFPDDNPVLLHELIHRWHFAKLANTPRVQPLRDAFAAEKAAPHWAAQAYLYKNISEYLAMCASVVIHGRAARPPFTRDQTRTKLPATYAFIVTEFGVSV